VLNCKRVLYSFCCSFAPHIISFQVWAGDLNYALHESVEGVECRAELESKGLGNAPSLQDEGLGSRFRSQWAAADQLSSVRAAVRDGTIEREID